MSMDGTLDDRCIVQVTKLPGDERYACSMEASSSAAAIQAMCCQIYHIAQEMEVPVEQVLAKIATVLLYREEKGE